ncbi:MAG: hypothetical protein IPJ88_10020 [Myxococcales bacterium]|nr:MAG: hypothetical protein IPJ88_10020 [Myxococcales bacterium]
MEKSSTPFDYDFNAVSYEQWKTLVDKDLKGAPFERKLVKSTLDDQKIGPLYSAIDEASFGDTSQLPGQHPFERGLALQNNAEPSIKITGICRFGSKEKIGQSIDSEIKQGLSAVRMRTSSLHTTDAKDGIAVNSITDMLELSKSALVQQTELQLDAGADFFEMAALLVVASRKAGVSADKLNAQFNADPFEALVRDGELPISLQSALDRAQDLARYTVKQLPRSRSLRVSSSALHNAGASQVQELAFLLASFVDYLRAYARDGLSVSQVIKQMVVEQSVGTEMFSELAKIRASRKLLALALKECGAEQDLVNLRMHVHSSERMLCQRDPWVNLLRTTVSTAVAMMSDVDSVSVSPYDSALRPSDESARRLARNTALILQQEGHLKTVQDPAGGSWFVESRTEQLAQAAWSMFQSIEAQGGFAKALQSGWIHDRIKAAREKRSALIATRKFPITGVSEFPNLNEQPLPSTNSTTHKNSVPEATKNAKTSFQAALADCSSAFEASLTALEEGLPAATLARELKEQALKKDGSVATVADLKAIRFAEDFEHLRDASDRYLKKHGTRPRVLLANMGPLAKHIPRTMFSQNFLEAGGIQALSDQSFQSVDELMRTYKKTPTDVVIICSSDELYQEYAQPVCKALKEAGAKHVLLAGYPGEHEQQFKQAGIDNFIFLGCSTLTTLSELHSVLGVEA